jgi:SAM-dependent methyltransferase
MEDLAFTGERIVPGLTPAQVFREHEMRYRFAAGYVRDRIVLDVASGTGVGTLFLLKSGAKACMGIELDHRAAVYAASAYPECSFIRGDAGQMCLADEALDVVVSFETIEHLQDPVQFLNECQRVLRPGGLLICSTPNRSVYGLWGGNPFHVRELTLEEFRNHIETLFDDCQLYGQIQVNYLAYLSRFLILKFLERIRVKGLIKLILRRPAPGIATETDFDSHALFPELEVKQIVPKRLVRPTYLVAVARKRA